jgi:hypothetical protein
MKKLLSLLALSLILMYSCKKEDPEPQAENGKLILEIGMSIYVDEIDNRLKSANAIEDFKVAIYNADGSESISFETLALMPDTIELAPGDYYVEAHSDNNLPAAFENPYYYGVSDVFSISSNTQQAIQVTCSLANTIVSVIYSDNVMNNFDEYSTTVSTSLGSLIYNSEETRPGYFQTAPMDILVELSYLNPDGTQNTKTLSGNISDPLTNRHYQVNVDASIDQGMALFQVLLDSSEVQVEYVELTEEPVIPDGTIAYGELLITEIMPDPSALSDTEGEWFEIYNNSDHTINLQNLILERNGSDVHTITDSIELSAGEFYVMARTPAATDAVNTYVYGTDILLTNSGSVVTIYNEGDESVPGALIFSVDYGATGYPSGPGSSISLNPAMFNAADAILGTSWCLSSSVYNTGDSGTPGLMNDLCE